MAARRQGPALHPGRREPQPARNPDARGADRRSHAPTLSRFTGLGAAIGSPGRRLGTRERTRAAADRGWCGTFAQAHVLLARAGGARTRVSAAPRAKRPGGCRGMVRPTRLSMKTLA